MADSVKSLKDVASEVLTKASVTIDAVYRVESNTLGWRVNAGPVLYRDLSEAIAAGRLILIQRLGDAHKDYCKAAIINMNDAERAVERSEAAWNLAAFCQRLLTRMKLEAR